MKEEVKEFLKKYSAKDVSKKIEAAVELQILYKSSFNRNIDCITCESKMMAAYNELVIYSQNNIIHTMSENFKMKQGIQIFLHSQHRVIHSGNLETDEQAIELLAKNKGLIEAFSDYPEDWENKVADFIIEKEKAEIEKIESEKKAAAQKEVDHEVLKEELKEKTKAHKAKHKK